MLRIAGNIVAASLAIAVIGGSSMAYAAAQPSRSARHGAEKLVLMGTSTKSATVSVIATGLINDGGVTRLTSNQSEVRLGSGTFRLSSKTGPAKNRFNAATCVTTITGGGTYTLSHGTGKYAHITGSGHFVTSGQSVFPRKAGGACSISHPLAVQVIITLRGPVTLGS